MGNEFAALDRLSSLEADAKKAVHLIEEAGEGSQPSKSPKKQKPAPKRPTAIKQQPISTAQTDSADEERTRQVSTMLRIKTHRRVMRAAKLQAADQKLPDSLWAILDEAANRWCDENGY